jgi:hypothetical protein
MTLVIFSTTWLDLITSQEVGNLIFVNESKCEKSSEMKLSVEKVLPTILSISYIVVSSNFKRK